VSSVSVLTETANILRSKLHQPDGDVRAAVKLTGRAATLVKPASRINVLEDEPDNRILECAVSAAADAIVTGDRHLLALKRFRGIAIVRLADFLRMFPPEPEE
jgi:putative PIN family toxin of toxin-antitoxin system